MLFHFACAKRTSHFRPGEEFLYVLYLYENKEYETLLSEVDELKLGSIKDEQANKIAYLASLTAVALGDGERAETYFNYCLSNYPILADYALYHLSRVYAEGGNFKGALALGERLIAEHPDSVWVSDMTVAMGEYSAGLGEDQKALEIYDAYLRDNKKSDRYPTVLLLKGVTLEGMGMHDDAREIYKRIWLAYPQNEASVEAFGGLVRLGGIDTLTEFELYERVKILYDSNRFSEGLRAIDEIPALLSTRTSNLKTRYYLELIRAKCYYQRRKYEKALTYFEKLWKQPGNLSKPELLYWRAKTFDKLEKDSVSIKTCIELTVRYPQSPYADDALYLAARTAEEIGDFDRALGYYKKYLTTYSHSSRVKDILWYIGWIYYQREEYEDARVYFERLANSYRTKNTYPQYIYWIARTLEKQQKNEEAVSLYRELWYDFPTTYYSYQAGERLKKLGFSVSLDTAEKVTDDHFWGRTGLRYYTSFTSDERITRHIEKSLELMAMDRGDDAKRELDLVLERCVGDPELLIEVARLFRLAGDYYTPIIIANHRFTSHLDEYHPGENDVFWQMKYPEGYKREVEKISKEYDLDPALIYSVIRAESMFQPTVSSWAGALGLMQIIPSTGNWIARSLEITDFEVEDLLDYRTNLAFGVYYLAGLMGDFDGEMVYALCGYNAGPGNARKWISAKETDTEMDEFIENIPYPETRTYVKRILEYYSIYRVLYEGKNSIQ
jgi:soluble lytic murein transglycosylase